MSEPLSTRVNKALTYLSQKIKQLYSPATVSNLGLVKPDNESIMVTGGGSFMHA